MDNKKIYQYSQVNEDIKEIPQDKFQQTIC